MKVVFKNEDDKKSFLKIVNRSDANVAIGGTTITDDTANVVNDIALNTDVDVEVENPRSTFGFEVIEDLQNAGLVKGDDNGNLSDGWCG